MKPESIALVAKLSAYGWICGWLAWSGFRPGHHDPKKWYDRAIRIVGGLMLLALMVGGLIYTIWWR
jgi:hypothetical protein